MPKVTFRTADGVVRLVDAASGSSLMEGAVGANVPGILAECGGACACATCHVHVDEEWIGHLPPAGEIEASMLDYVQDAGPTSRLACQIVLTAELDGLSVLVPEAQ
ncbi:2Fe-2S iron-sulfur cluster-binding protein [Azospirillum sp. CT11-132]|uniref:2Fe-2S iron-sulfur cluster-binding protein n=1 Tax=Azospirillum sp. CT11-132 TaxID=3396317 RepID=UPI0039A47035